MPRKYRIVRTEPGVLDLSRVLDDQGKPVILCKRGDTAIINARALRHPHIKQYLGIGLRVEEISLTPVQAPRITRVPVTTAPPSAPPPPPVIPESESVTQVPEIAAPVEEILTSADISNHTDSASDEEDSSPSDTDKKGKSEWRSSKRSRNK